MRLLTACLFAATAVALTSISATADEKGAKVLDHRMKAIDGKEVNLAEKYKGKVLLVVNVASACGLTKQYTQLEALQDKYHSKGLDVVGFPCNQFAGQEPGNDAEIVKFCKAKYNVSFDLFSKIEVNGPDAAPIYKQLTNGKDISWNFEKFVIGRNGEVVARFEPKTLPDAPEVIQAIEAELAKPAK
ncbi:glutathione peroxidase [Schlesneria paludicola]|uniref:glutathione peroxidase n=1 Tax=Schlesneria paludicola TaxID=360056 RepID=UPI00029A55D9|nr:glutathione peroxidase [Schlesneria paludicola]